MKKKILFALLSLASVAVGAQENPLWMRYPAISPVGKLIAFAYKGDIFTVDSNGGQARQLTTNPAYDYMPVWSPDGSQIAFASNREGSFDVYVVEAKGGTPRRLTTNSSKELPVEGQLSCAISNCTVALGRVDSVQRLLQPGV